MSNTAKHKKLKPRFRDVPIKFWTALCSSHPMTTLGTRIRVGNFRKCSYLDSIPRQIPKTQLSSLPKKYKMTM